jgi:gliding motility-associated-like protein
MKKTLLYGFIIFLALFGTVNAQTAYNMGGNAIGTIGNGCGGIFYDSGGAGGNYQDNENDSVTFCAPAGQYISFTFTSFTTDNFFDILNVYNGPSSGSHLLGSYSGTTTIPTIYSSLGGCITFVFTSDASVNYSGWAANIGCSSTPPPPPAPGAACSTANPFCTGINYSFPNSTGNTTGLGTIDCLFSTPNPVWYFMQIGTSGTVVIDIAQTDASGNALDVDYDCWGPFTNLSSGCTAISAGTATSVSCSYSSSNTETCTINNAIVGQYYALLLTNYSNQPGTITFGSDPTSTGATNCNIINCGVTASNTGPYCVGQTISLNAATTNTTATTYSWSGPGGYTNTGPSITIPNSTAAMSGTYSVTGTTGGTVTCVATTSVTVGFASPPVVASNSICAGGTAVLTATGPAASYTWSTGVATASITVSPLTTTVYSVTGSIGTCTATATVTVTVIPNPTITVNSGTICTGNTLALMANTGGGVATFSWAPPTGLSNTSMDTVTASPPSTTIYTVSGAIGTCSATPVTTTVTVVAAIVPTVASNTPCVNQTLNLNCNAGYTTYLWSGPNAFTSAVQNPTKPGITVASSGTYSVVVTDANNCINTATVNVIVNPLPVVTAAASPACLNNPITLSATPGFVSYTWSGPGGYTAVGQTAVIANASLANAGFYAVNVVDVNGCANLAPVQVIVYNPPIVKTNDTTLCLLTTGTLLASGAQNYSWNPTTDLNTNMGNIVSVTPSAVATTVYTVTGADINGCINTATAVVNVNPLPTVSILPGITKGCTPQCANYTVTSSSGASAYSWNFGNNQYSTNASPVACFTIAGTYAVKLTLTDTNHCKNTATASVIAYPIPTADFNYTPDPATILEPTITFLNSSSGTIKHYTWNFGDSLSTSVDTSNLINPKHTYVNVGSYPVTLVALSINGCSDTMVRTVIIEQDFALFVPNAFSPNGDGKNEIFKAEGEGITDFKMYIFDRWGNSVFTTIDINVGWDGRMNNRIGVDILQHDVYVWKIELKNVSHQGKTYTGTVTLVR